eukprot:3273251-Pyramimonas_sp.AAC.1
MLLLGFPALGGDGRAAGDEPIGGLRRALRVSAEGSGLLPSGSKSAGLGRKSVALGDESVAHGEKSMVLSDRFLAWPASGAAPKSPPDWALRLGGAWTRPLCSCGL